MDPTLALSLGFAVLDEAINMIRGIQAQSGMSNDQIAAHAETLDLQNLDDIKKLAAL